MAIAAPLPPARPEEDRLPDSLADGTPAGLRAALERLLGAVRPVRHPAADPSHRVGRSTDGLEPPQA